jgi:hypothetical protein
LRLGVTFQVKHLCVGDFASFAEIFADFYFGRGIESCLELILSHKPSVPSSQNNKPIWEIVDEIIATIPEESFKKIPTDATINLDYYLDGNPPQE